jgi:hypothetical protein
MDIACLYDYSDFVGAINEERIVLAMSDENAEYIMNQSVFGNKFCKLLTFAFAIPWVALFLVAFFTDINENLKIGIFVCTCLISGSLYKVFLKIKINQAVKILLEDPVLYRRCLLDFKFMIKDNPDFKEY